ncbi:GNAT family N-acetyltransferase [Phenylobacterium sp.]|uniref:GNAT family N-acetyltransferase n=1 Tax=Phenylobacterium sp. TaxID=1871053 RepID=UPI0027362581|nr:GNAT family N-acetyltransferase [Phenylobacterium sp.]MDP3659695.1 GNAT family N-acetyltransferase [Phenylobacterium sp.]
MSTSPIAVRRAGTQDAPALGRLGALLVSLHHDYDAQRFIAPTPGTERGYGAFLASEIERKDAIILVAEQDGEVIGYVYAAMEGHDWMALRGPAGVIHDLLVDPTRRNKGIGGMLLLAALNALTALGAPRVILSTAMRNDGAQRLFANAGFRATMVEMTRERPDARPE